jgi:hypothetical protein
MQMVQQNNRSQLRGQAPKTLLRAATTLGLALFAMAGFAAIAVSHASAAFACSQTNDCHSQAEDDMGHNNGVMANIYFTCLHSPNSSDYVTNEMWDVTGHSGSTNYWIETGVIDGYSSKTRAWFSANQTPSVPFNVYFPSGFAEANYSIQYAAKIEYSSTQTWDVTGGNSFVHINTVHGQPNNTFAETAGTEFSDQTGMRDSGSVIGLQWEDSNGVWNLWGSGGRADPPLGPNNHITPSYHSSSSTVDWSDC